MQKARQGKTFKVKVINGEVKCNPMEHHLHERKYEIFEVRLGKKASASYELMRLHFETNPRQAFKDYQIDSSFIELHDDNQRNVPIPTPEKLKFSIRVRETGAQKRELFLDPIVIND